MSVYDIKGQTAVWDFRANEDWMDSEEIIKFLQKTAKKWVFQLEQGETTGYRHWQGRLSLFKKLRGDKLAELFENYGAELPNYLQPASKNSTLGDNFYACKEQTRILGPWSDKDGSKQYVQKRCRNATLRPFQQQIADTAKAGNDRIIDCLVEDIGDKGKSFMIAYLTQHGKAVEVPVILDAERLLAATLNILMSSDNRDPGLIFLDLARAMPKNKLDEMWAACEKIKDGKVYDLRYSYKEWVFEPPTVWVMTNSWPQTTCLSKGRWRFWKLDETDTLVRAEPPKKTNKRPRQGSDEEADYDFG
nr:MAG: replication associated protein [Arizlama virus]